MQSIIETQNLTKHFGDTKAVDQVSIHIRPSEIYGFLGLNGAGKTTTIRLMLGMIKPDEGNILLFGETIKNALEIWNKVGYMVETPHSYPNLTVTENLKVLCKLRGIKSKKPIDEVIERLKLTQYKDKKAKHLSLGNNQRLGLAKALIHKPKLLILDEPINGLDPAGIVEIREFLKELTRVENTTIFLSSHILSEIAKLATRVGIVHSGNLVKEINTKDLENLIIRRLKVNTLNNDKALKLLNGKGFNFEINKEGVLESPNQKAINNPGQIATLLVHSMNPPDQLQIDEEDLESYFLRTIDQ